MTGEELVRTSHESAHKAHEGQVRKYTGEAYILHCREVAHLVAGKTDDLELYAVAMLHDTLEDTDTTYEQLVEAFGERVAGLVRELTDVYTKAAYPDKNRAERKRLECARYRTVSDDAKLIKHCALIDNTSTIVEHDPNFAKVYLREKADLLEAMGF